MLFYLLFLSSCAEYNISHGSRNIIETLDAGSTLIINFQRTWGSVTLNSWKDTRVCMTFDSGKPKMCQTFTREYGALSLGNESGQLSIYALAKTTVKLSVTTFDDDCDVRTLSTLKYYEYSPFEDSPAKNCYFLGGNGPVDYKLSVLALGGTVGCMYKLPPIVNKYNFFDPAQPITKTVTEDNPAVLITTCPRKVSKDEGEVKIWNSIKREKYIFKVLGLNPQFIELGDDPFVFNPLYWVPIGIFALIVALIIFVPIIGVLMGYKYCDVWKKICPCVSACNCQNKKDDLYGTEV